MKYSGCGNHFIAITLITYNITHLAIRQTCLILLAETSFTENSFRWAKFFLHSHASKSAITLCQSVKSLWIDTHVNDSKTQPTDFTVTPDVHWVQLQKVITRAHTRNIEKQEDLEVLIRDQNYELIGMRDLLG